MTWQESTPVWCWRSWTQMKLQNRASGWWPSGKVKLHDLTTEQPACFEHVFVFLQTSGDASCLCSPTSSAVSIQVWRWPSCRIKRPKRRTVRVFCQVLWKVLSLSNSFILDFTALSSSELAGHFTPYDLKRLELYSRSMVDYHLIMDLVPVVARIFFLKQLGDMSLSAAQCVCLWFYAFLVPLGN